VLPNTLLERSFTSGKIALQVGSTKINIRSQSADVSLALGPMAPLRRALDKCMSDLRTQWRMVDGQLPKPAFASHSQGDVRKIFSSNDYPEDALGANQSGATQFLLMIGPDGSVMDCVVAQSSGVASLDAMGCQVIRERARFKPATDANGKPTVDTYVTPVIRWKVS
jgi:TonB family protein